MNIKTALIIGAAILIGASIMSSDKSSDIQYSNDSYSETSYDNNYSNGNQAMANEENFNQIKTTRKSSNNDIIMQPSMDVQRGVPFGHYPLPSDWKINKNGWTGPKGTKVTFMTSKPMEDKSKEISIA